MHAKALKVFAVFFLVLSLLAININLFNYIIGGALLTGSVVSSGVVLASAAVSDYALIWGLIQTLKGNKNA